MTPRSPWLPRGLLGGGGLLLLGAGAVVASYRSGFGCGPLLLDRYSPPVFAALAMLLIAGGLAVVGALRLPPERIARLLGGLAMMAFGVGLALALIEGFVRVALPERAHTVDNLNIANHDLIGSWRRPNHAIERRGYTYRSDEQGILILTDQGNTPPPGARRIMVLGDSFVEGMQVAPDQNMTVRLMDLLDERQPDAYHVLNLGMSGFGPLRYLMVYRAFAPQYRPDAVIVAVFVENDFGDDARLFHQDRIIADAQGAPLALKPEVDLDRMEVWGPRKGVEHLRRAGLSSLWPLRLLDFARQRIASPLCVMLNARAQTVGMATEPEVLQNVDSAIYGPLAPEDVENVARTLSYLETLRREAQAAGAQVYLVIIPDMGQVYGGTAIEKTTQPQEILLAFCAEQDLSCLDLLPIFVEHKDQAQLYFPEDGHFTAEGHRLAAEAMAGMLRAGGPSP